ncbi:MAG: thioredoxin family protein [Pseudomonadota bacterium]
MEIKNIDQANEPSRADIERSKGAVLVEFGAIWCEYCQAAQPIIASTLVNYPNIQHIKIEDGKGRSLGRSYSVKLWPTLIFLSNGQEVKRLVRPVNSEDIVEALDAVSKAS